MISRIGILDYGVGNRKSLMRALHEVSDKKVELISSPNNVDLYDAVILPGVGAFGPAMAALVESGLDEFISKYSELERPLIGICLGMQLLTMRSTEGGQHPGLGLIKGQTSKLHLCSGKMVQINWKSVQDFSGKTCGHYYFLHYFHVELECESDLS